MTHREQSEYWLLQADRMRGANPTTASENVQACERRAGVHALLALGDVLTAANDAVEALIPDAEVVPDGE